MTNSRTKNAKDALQNCVVRDKQSYLRVILELKKSSNGLKTYMDELTRFLGVLQDSDSSIVILNYREEVTITSDMVAIDKNKVLAKKEDMPKTITKLGKYFNQGRPDNQGGKVYINIRIAHTEEIELILEETEYELQEMESRMFLQTIQHHDSIIIGWLFLFHYEADVSMWANWFSTMINKKLKREVLFGMMVKPLFDGNKEKNYKDRTKGVMCETTKKDSEAVKDALKKILESKAFKDMYGEEVRLIPKYDGKGSTNMRESVVKCIQYQQAAMKGVQSYTVYSLKYADTRIKELKLSPREMLMQMKAEDEEKIFLTVERSWAGDGYKIYYKTHYQDEALTRLNHLGAYCVHDFGNEAEKAFTEEEQERIQSTVWENNIPKGVEEQDIGAIDISNKVWIDLSLLNASKDETKKLKKKYQDAMGKSVAFSSKKVRYSDEVKQGDEATNLSSSVESAGGKPPAQKV